MANVERESNNSDHIQLLINTPEKDNENRGRKKVHKIKIARSGRGGVQLPSLLAAVLLRLVLLHEKRKSKKEKEKGQIHGVFPRKVKRVINETKWRISNLQKNLPF